jgi:hypothetical protein
MKFLTSLFLVLIINSALAHESNEPNLYSRLLEINKEWKHVPSREYQEKVNFSNDKDLISTHLNLVISLLRNNAPKYLQPEQLDNRLSLLSKLQVYAQAKIFPSNLYHRERTPYFIDHLGAHCAVGYMIQQSGRPDLAFEIQNRENYAYIRDIQTLGVQEWAEINGFNLQELAWIQPAYLSQETSQSIDGGTNGEVTDMAYDQIDDKLYFIGDFSSVSGSTDFCGKVAFVQNDLITCISEDLHGDPTSIFLVGTSVFLTGEFLYHGDKYNLARYQGSGDWNYENVSDHGEMPTVRMYFDPTATTIDPNFVIDLGNIHEVWANETFPNNVYMKKMTVYGKVHHLSHTGNEYIYAGDFDSCLVHTSQGDSIIYTNNILLQDLGGNYYSPTGDYPEIIYSVDPYNSQFLVSGQCNNANNNTCISKLNPNTYHATTEIPYGYIESTSPGGLETATIKSLQVRGVDEFYISGDFKAGNMTIGYNLAFIKELPNQDYGVHGRGTANRVINDFHRGNGTTIIGGDFNADAFRSDLNHLAKISGTNHLNEEVISNFSIIPNPSSGKFKLHFDEPQNGTIRIYALNGQILEEIELKNQMSMDMNLSNLNQGLYLLSVQSAKGTISKRIEIK